MLEVIVVLAVLLAISLIALAVVWGWWDQDRKRLIQSLNTKYGELEKLVAQIIFIERSMDDMVDQFASLDGGEVWYVVKKVPRGLVVCRKLHPEHDKRTIDWLRSRVVPRNGRQ